MSTHKLARGLVEIPRGVNTSHSDNSNFMNSLERTNSLLVQFLSSPENIRMMLRTELEESYFNLTIYNLRESIKHKIEQDMWNNLFKKHVSELQGKLKSKDKIEVAKGQSELSLFLDEAMGFYSKFLDVLSLIHNIRLPGRSLCTEKSIINKDSRIGDDVSEQDLCYIAQHCFVHLGDLSRYHNLHKLARLNYNWAVELNPNSGHAYNQLAILESSTVSQVLNHNNYSRLLHTILYYNFASTCQTPFPATHINLDSLLRHIHSESVSELLTSNNSIDVQNCHSSLSVAWLHAYASMKLRNNIQRCRQLQQRIIDWTTDMVKYHEASSTHWRDIVTIVALQCALMTSNDSTNEIPEANIWSSNLHQFTQDLLSSMSQGLVSISHDVKLLDNVLNKPGCVSVFIVFMSWLNQFIMGRDSEKVANKINLKIPFGEQLVKFLNVLHAKISLRNSVDKEGPVNLPNELPELQFLMGYEPLKVPCKPFSIFCDTQSSEKPSSIEDTSYTRASFIVRVAQRLANEHQTMLGYNSERAQFSSVIPKVEAVAVKKTRADPVTMNKKPVNVALASIRSNAGPGMDKRRYAPFQTPAGPGHTDTVTGVVSDVQIAKCIQEHIALETTHSLLPPEASFLLTTSSPIRDESSHGMAPAPGLILSSNLPADYKTMSVATTSAAEMDDTHGPSAPLAQSHANDTADQLKSTNAKSHGYNPNREQFEKDLPPRFASKRCSSQKDSNKAGFKSLNYWDSSSTYQNTSSNCDTNLTKKESEMLLPPSVPSSWLMDEQHDLVGRHSMDTNVAMSPLHFQMTDAISQQRSPFNNTMHQNPMNLFQSPFDAYQKHQMMADQDNTMMHFAQTTSSNPTNFSYQTSPNSIDQSRIKFNQVFMPQTTAYGTQQNFPPIPPPPQQAHNLGHTAVPLAQAQMMYNKNLDQFSMPQQTSYDKPIFSTSNQSGYGYTPSSIMAQQHQQLQQQNHSLPARSNNPLLNLLPGYMNEMQR